MLKKLQEKKGFTLVEVIVVLIILAILAALLIPTLTGYIDKANQRAVVAEGRAVAMAAQTLTSEAYALTRGTKNPTVAEVATLAEVPVANITAPVFDSTTGNVSFTYSSGGWSVSYTTAGGLTEPVKTP